MLNKDLWIAGIISLAVHSAWLGVFDIRPSPELEKGKVYTRVEFLGPILGKTAFDLVHETTGSPHRFAYSEIPGTSFREETDLRLEKKFFSLTEEKNLPEPDLKKTTRPFLRASKLLPQFMLDTPGLGAAMSTDRSTVFKEKSDRIVLYRPEPPTVYKNMYGDNRIYALKVNALISREGRIRLMEPITTTGYPEVDVMGLKYLKGWLFEFRREPEWRLIDVIIETREYNDQT